MRTISEFKEVFFGLFFVAISLIVLGANIAYENINGFGIIGFAAGSTLLIGFMFIFNILCFSDSDNEALFSYKIIHSQAFGSLICILFSAIFFRFWSTMTLYNGILFGTLIIFGILSIIRMVVYKNSKNFYEKYSEDTENSEEE